ncbi:MAG: HAMP domain-containing protein [Acidobacteria bacterium]|nr:HAMP domain-containing protein [Acidobacteriota bacterium]
MLNVWSKSLRRQMVVALVLMLVPMVVAAGWLGYREYQETVEELTNRTNATAVRTAAAIQRELEGFDRMAVNLSLNPDLKNLDEGAGERLLRPYMRLRFPLAAVAILDRNGRVIAGRAASMPVPGDGPEVSAAVLRMRRRFVSPLKTSPSGHHYVIVAYPIGEEKSETAGAVLACYVTPQMLRSTFGDSLLPAGAIVMLTQMDRRILAHTENPDQNVGRTLEMNVHVAPELPRQHDSADGIRRIFAQATVDHGPWVVTVGVPISFAVARAVSLRVETIPILGLALCGWLFVAILFLRRLTTSVGHLDTTARRIASGDFGPIERRPMLTREFASLQTAFENMLGRFNDTRAVLNAQMADERHMRQEVESLQRQVIRQERLAAVGQLVSGVAHEINNPLQAILGFAELLQMQSDLPESVKGDLLLIQKESTRACGIIRNLALFARQQTGDAEPVRLSDVISSVVELRQRRLESENIELRVEDGSSRHVMAVLAELQQVVLNFVVNAEQSIVLSGRQPGRITVRTRDEGSRVVLEVEDTGPGIAPETEAKLFQPFFTTKPVGQGTGLGLSVSYGIIDSLDGRIGYRGAPAGGAIFYFDLPAAA